MKRPKFGTKNALFGYFLVEISNPEFPKLQNVTKKQKCLNLGSKMPDLSILVLEFQKAIVIFEISTLKFVEMQNWDQKCLIWVFLG